MNIFSFIRTRPLTLLAETALVAGVAGLAIFGLGKVADASRRRRKAAAKVIIDTWEGEGGNIVPRQPSDAILADPPKAASVSTVTSEPLVTPGRA